MKNLRFVTRFTGQSSCDFIYRFKTPAACKDCHSTTATSARYPRSEEPFITASSYQLNDTIGARFGESACFVTLVRSEHEFARLMESITSRGGGHQIGESMDPPVLIDRVFRRRLNCISLKRVDSRDRVGCAAI